MSVRSSALSKKPQTVANSPVIFRRDDSGAKSTYKANPALYMHSLPVGNTYADAAADDEDHDSWGKSIRAHVSEERARRVAAHAQAEKKQYEESLQAIQFNGPQYSVNDQSPIKPCCEFWRCLLKRSTANEPDAKNAITNSRLRLNIPDTFVFGIEDNPFYMRTGSDGTVERVDNVTMKYIIAKLIGKSGDDDIVAVLKKPQFAEGGGNEVLLQSVKQLRGMVENPPGGVAILQRYITVKGRKATILRGVWSRMKPSVAWHIGNKITCDDSSEKDIRRLYTICTDVFGTLNIFKMSGVSVAEISACVKNIVQQVEATAKPRARFSECVADFIRDENGILWFIQTKAFVADIAIERDDDDDDVPVSKSGSGAHSAHSSKGKDHLRQMTCKSCMRQFPPQDLLYSLTVKMIYDMENHIKRRGVMKPWFNRPEFRVLSTSAAWYQTYKVCDECFGTYQQEQKMAQAEISFATSLGVPLDVKRAAENRDSTFVEWRNRQAIKERTRPSSAKPASRPSSASFSVSRMSSRPSSALLPRSSSASASAADIVDDIPIDDDDDEDVVPPVFSGPAAVIAPKSKGKLLMYRMAVFFHDVRQLPESFQHQDLSVELHVFNSITSIPLVIPPEEGACRVVPMQRIRVFHFFVEKEADFMTFLERQKRVGVHMIHGKQRASLGSTYLSFQQFYSGLLDRLEYKQIFSSTILNVCMVRATLGFIKGREMDISDLRLAEHQGVFIPEEEYFCSDPLPQEWQQLVNLQSAYLNTQKEIVLRRLTSENPFLDNDMDDFWYSSRPQSAATAISRLSMTEPSVAGGRSSSSSSRPGSAQLSRNNSSGSRPSNGSSSSARPLSASSARSSNSISRPSSSSKSSLLHPSQPQSQSRQVFYSSGPLNASATGRTFDLSSSEGDEDEYYQRAPAQQQQQRSSYSPPSGIGIGGSASSRRYSEDLDDFGIAEDNDENDFDLDVQAILEKAKAARREYKEKEAAQAQARGSSSSFSASSASRGRSSPSVLLPQHQQSDSPQRSSSRRSSSSARPSSANSFSGSRPRSALSTASSSGRLSRSGSSKSLVESIAVLRPTSALAGERRSGPLDAVRVDSIMHLNTAPPTGFYKSQ